MAKTKSTRIKLYIAVMFGSLFLGGCAGFLTAYLSSAPTLDQVNIVQDFTTYIYDINGRVITDLYRENRIPTDITKLPDHVKNAVIAIEDAQFYNHHGINFVAFARAIWVNLRTWDFTQGGGTITMQLARNLFLTQKKTIMRKLEEFLWAVQIERKYSKDEILEAYLNVFYLNHGAYGIEAGARLFFGKEAKDLTLSEAALIAGVIRWPSRYSPYVNPDIARDRRNFVLERMYIEGFITEAECRQAQAEPLGVIDRNQRQVRARYFVDYVIQDVISRYGESAVFGGGLHIYTSLDLDMQAAAEKALLGNLPVNKQSEGSGLTQPQGALIAIDPRTGHIKAMVGGRGEDSFNRATQALRPPGSAIKVFAYTAGIDKGIITPATVFMDEPTTFTLPNGQTWEPQNYYGDYSGPVTVREALEQSLNIVAAKVVAAVGPETAIEYGKKMGITTFVEQGRVNDVGLAPLALGGMTQGVSPIELASAYGVLANQGIWVEPIAILKITDAYGNVLEENRPQKKVVLSEETSYIMTDMLRGAVERGTGQNAKIGRPAAGKTGTTQDYRDAWFVGYIPELVAAVWFGEDTPRQMVYGGVRYGSWNAAAMWKDFMQEAVKKIPVSDFPKPSGIVEGILIDTETGLLVTEDCGLPKEEIRSEIFIKGTEPTEYSPRCQPQQSWWRSLLSR